MPRNELLTCGRDGQQLKPTSTLPQMHLFHLSMNKDLKVVSRKQDHHHQLQAASVYLDVKCNYCTYFSGGGQQERMLGNNAFMRCRCTCAPPLLLLSSSIVAATLNKRCSRHCAMPILHMATVDPGSKQVH